MGRTRAITLVALCGLASVLGAGYGFAPVATPQAQAVVIPGSPVDVYVNVAGPSSGVGNGAFSYTIKIGNNSQNDGDGATFTANLPTGASNLAVACAADAGATCGAPPAFAGSVLSGAVGLLPGTSSVTYTVTGNFAFSSASYTVSATVSPPAGTTDPNGPNTSSVGTTVSNPANLSVNTTLDAGFATQGDGSISAAQFTTSYTNSGQGPVTTAGLAINFTTPGVVGLAGYVTGYVIAVTSCQVSDGSDCPASMQAGSSHPTNFGGTTNIVSLTGVTVPVGTITMTYTLTPIMASPVACGAPSRNVSLVSSVSAPGYANQGSPVTQTVTAPLPSSPSCPPVHLSTTKTQSVGNFVRNADGTAFEPVTYTLTYTNAGPAPVSNVSVADLMTWTTNPAGYVTSAQLSNFRCSFSDPDGAISTAPCQQEKLNASGQPVPALNLTDRTIGTADLGRIYEVLSGTFNNTGSTPITLPVGTLTVSYTVTANIQASCVNNDNRKLVNTSKIAAPAGFTNDITWPQVASVDITTTIPNPPSCTPTSLSVTKAASNTSFDSSVNGYMSALLALPSLQPFTDDPNSANAPVRYTITYTNGGSATVNGASITDTFQFPSTTQNPAFGQYTITIVSCSFSSDPSLPCPSGVVDKPSVTLGTNFSVYSTTVPTFPVGALTIVYDVTPVLAAHPSCASGQRTLTSTATIGGPPGTTNTGTTSASTTTNINCSDLGVNKDVSGSTAESGDVLTYTIQLTNIGAATPAVILDKLPAGLIFDHASCATVPGSSCDSSTITYDSATGLITAPVTNVAPGAAVTLTVHATVGDATGSFDNGATAYPIGRVDPNPLSNVSSAQTSVYGDLTLKKTAVTSNPDDDSTVSAAGQTIHYTLAVTNTSGAQVSNLQVSEDSFTGNGGASGLTLDCSALPATLAVDATASCTADYTVTQSDIDKDAAITNTASATAQGGASTTVHSNTDQVSTDMAPESSIHLELTADPTEASTAGQVITYSYTITNTGTTTVSHPHINPGGFNGSVLTSLTPDCTGQPSSLAPRESIICTASYTVTQPDLDAGGPLVNHATANGNAGDAQTSVETNEAQATVDLTAAPAALMLTITPNPSTATTAGQLITYSYTVTNTGGVTVTNPIIHPEPFNGSGAAEITPDCSGQPTSLAPQQSIVCTASYTVILRDLVTSSALHNPATASADVPTSDGAVTSARATATVELNAVPPQIQLKITGSPERVSFVGQKIDYRLEITNTGSVTVTDLGITLDGFTGAGLTPVIDCSQAAQTVKPGESTTCTASYTVVAKDLATTDNTIVLSATASGKNAAGVRAQSDGDTTTTVSKPLTLPPTLPPGDPSTDGNHQLPDAQQTHAPALPTTGDGSSPTTLLAAGLLLLGGLAASLRDRHRKRTHPANSR